MQHNPFNQLFGNGTANNQQSLPNFQNQNPVPYNSHGNTQPNNNSNAYSYNYNSQQFHPTNNGKQFGNLNQQQQSQQSDKFSQFDTSIGLQKLSPKQLLCECIDLATDMFKQVVDHYVQINNLESPYEGKKVVDFALLANYMLEPSRLEKILTQFIPNNEQSVKALVKSWIFELKYIRNLWAHSEKITHRLAIRGFDTLGLLFESFNGDQTSDLYRKIEKYRKTLLISEAKLYVNAA